MRANDTAICRYCDRKWLVGDCLPGVCDDCQAKRDLADDFWNAQSKWSQATFGTDEERGPMGPLKHLEKESREAIEALRDVQAPLEDGVPNDELISVHAEIVDCQFLAFDAARRAGMTFAELFAKCFEKLAINESREWPKPATKNDVVERVR